MFAIAPQTQTVSSTIATLCSRLSSATLLEDRRGAILGLRSFAKEYPASVASGSLRGLINSLAKDGEDVDTVKVVLETLLMLFNPNEASPEASEEIALWLADEFTQRQENITVLLGLVDAPDFYSRLYSLQLLAAILSARAERTEECILTAPLGISRLVTALDDKREAIRNEALTLLTYLTPTSSELQKLVAFENAFDRIFNIIKLEGALSYGDRVVEDALILLANLLRHNVSNQSFFRETGCVSKLAQLLHDVNSNKGNDEPVAEWVLVQSNRNLYALLAVVRLFLVEGSMGLQANQLSFWQHGVSNRVLQLAFEHITEAQIKAEALTTCADLIRGNAKIQESFAQLQVPAVLDENSNESHANGTITKVYVIDGLLDLMLVVSSLDAFDARFAASECIKSYFQKHPVIKLHFLRRAIDGHFSGADETANVLTTLLKLPDSRGSGDPYRCWFAATIAFHLIFEDAEAKSILMGVTEGDSSNGEEEITCIQAVTANLITGVQKREETRILVAYLMLLCGWLYEDPDAVNDFLGEGSNVHSLIRVVQQPSADWVIVQGLCAVLLGIIYEFSTKDSPVPRATLHQLLATGLGQDIYSDRLARLRGHPLMRDFEVLPQKLDSSNLVALPEVYFNTAFADFFKDNFSRFLRATERDPGFEIPVVTNGVQKGISREMVDSLKTQLEEKEKSLLELRASSMTLERQLGQEQADHRRTKETKSLELGRIQNVNSALQRHHEEDISKLKEEQNVALLSLKRQLEHVQRAADGEAERHRRRAEAEVTDLKFTIDSLRAEVAKITQDHSQDLKIAHDEYTKDIASNKFRMENAEAKAREADARSSSAQSRAKAVEKKLADKEAEHESTQNELDELLMVITDLEDKSKSYKARLKALDEEVSDGEDNDEDDPEGEDSGEDEAKDGNGGAQKTATRSKAELDDVD